MRRSRRFAMLAIVAGSLQGAVFVPLALKLAVGKQPAEPLVLSFHDTPLLSGGHEHSVVALSFSADGKSLASGAGRAPAAVGRGERAATLDARRGLDSRHRRPGFRSTGE